MGNQSSNESNTNNNKTKDDNNRNSNIENRSKFITIPEPDLKQSLKRKKSTDDICFGKDFSDQCFTNIANNYYCHLYPKSVIHDDILPLDHIDSNPKSDTQNSSEITNSNQSNNNTNTISIRKISKSMDNLNQTEHAELPKTNSIKELQDTFSHPDMKTALLQPKDLYDEGEDYSMPKHFDINIDIKSVFKNVKPIHEEYPEEEIEKRSMSICSNRSEYELNFYRNGEEIRRSYIAKLIYKQVWKPSQKEKTHNSLIIFDWDDTLLCTSFLTPNGIFDDNMQLSDKDKEKISKLEVSVYRLLKLAIEKGDVYIITNASGGWVEYSSEKFYPSIKTLLAKIKIISAREQFEDKHPGENRLWKIQAFLNMKKDFDSDLVTNLICLGDSFIEMDAARILATKFTQAFIKTVKFKENPKPDELNKQLNLVADQFNDGIYAPIKNLTIRVERKKK